jgi:hypothetical protein
MLAGGVRNQKIAEPDAFTVDPRPRGVGANPADRLVVTQWYGSIPNLRHTGHPVLGSRPSCRRGVAPSAFLGT